MFPPSQAEQDMADNFDVIVIGGGPGGYNAAIRLGQLGLSSACIDKRGTFGGTCLNVGCIPSKALLHASERLHEAETDFAKLGIKAKVELDLPAMMAQKTKVVGELTKGVEFLLKKNKSEAIVGEARITGPGKVEVKLADGKTRSLTCKNIIIATGSDVAPLPGVTIDEKQIVSSTGAIALSSVPKKLLVVGAGVIGLELGSVWKRLGAEVTVVEFLDRITPGIDGEISKTFQRILTKQGLTFQLSTKVTGVEKTKAGLKVTVEPAAGGDKSTIECDVMLVSIGRIPFTGNLGLAEVGVAMDKRGRIVTDNHFKTNVPGIYAVGDVREGVMLAHKAEDEGTACAETIMATDGMVKIMADAKTDRVLGCAIVGPEAGNLIAEVVLAMEFGASSEDIARTCHSHPTLTEAVRQAAMGVEGWTMQM
jgi:dihydrolipoamide dehydrogenase